MDYDYKKPIYDPFIIFNPSQALVREVIKELKEETYAKTKRIQEIEQAGWPVPSWLSREHDTFTRRIRDYEYRLANFRRTGSWERRLQADAITEEDIANAKRVPIESLYNEGPLRRSPGRFVGRCPFHTERTASFTIYSNNNTYYCFGCSVGGDVLDFVQRTNGINFVEAVKMLVNK